MSGNIELLQTELRQHAYDMLAVNTVREYEKQIGEWKKYINRVVDAEAEALRNHQETLKKMAEEEKKKAEADAMIVMLALSLVSGPILSWISGAIQYKLVPNLTGTIKTRFVNTNIEWIDGTVTSKIVGTFNEETHNKVMAKLVGDLGKDLAGKAGNGVMSLLSSNDLQQISPRQNGTSYQSIIALTNQSNADSFIHSLRTTLENALIDEQAKTVDAITALATYIKRHLNWGKFVLEAMYKTKPETKKLSGTPLKWAGYKYVEEIVDINRKNWADGWFYYGHNPPNTSTVEMSRSIEREMWALWILNQEFKLEEKSKPAYGDVDNVDIEWNEVKGKDKLPFGSTLLNRLAELNIISHRSTDQQARSIIYRQQMDSEKFTPVSGISGDVDEQKELKIIEEWAKTHQPALIARMHNTPKRTLKSIGDYKS